MTVICIECHKPIIGARPQQELHPECYRVRGARANYEKNKVTTRGNVRNGNIRAASKRERERRQTSATFSDIMYAPPDRAASWINRILSGEMTVSG